MEEFSHKFLATIMVEREALRRELQDKSAVPTELLIVPTGINQKCEELAVRQFL